MKRENYSNVRLVYDEIEKCFKGWNERIKNNQHPVPIQDLDFWSKLLREVINSEDAE